MKRIGARIFLIYFLFLILISCSISSIFLFLLYPQSRVFQLGYFILLMTITIFIIYLIIHIKILNIKKVPAVIESNILKDRCILYYQPIIDFNQRNIRGWEALIRYKSDSGSLLTPDKFLENFRRNGMMPTLSIWILKEAIKQYHKMGDYRDSVREDLYISINISTIELLSKLLIDNFINILSQSGLDEHCICLEVTERDEIIDTKLLCANLKLLNDAGFLIAIDDFGSGYATLSLLYKIPFNILKIDKSLTDSLQESLMNQYLLKYISIWGNDFNKALVFEGVENEIQINFIKKLDIKQGYIQGYYYSKPLAEHDMFNYTLRSEQGYIDQ